MKRPVWGSIVVAVLLAVSGSRAAAQDISIPRLLPELVKLSAVTARGETGDHRDHFVLGLTSAAAFQELNHTVLGQAAGWSFEPTFLTSRRPGNEPRLFGAGFNDAAFTIGSKRMVFSVSYQSMTYAQIDGIELRDSQLNLYVPHASVTGDESDRDMMQQTASLRVNRKTALFSLARGFGNRVDVRIVVPVVQMALDARVVTQIIRTASPNSPALHAFDATDGATQVLARFCGSDDTPDALACQGSSTARGLGDIVLGTKIGLLTGKSGLAIGVDVRLPTGDEDELIGLGATQIRPALLWSLDLGRTRTRIRADYTWSDGQLTSRLAEDLPGLNLNVADEFGAGAGVDIDILPYTTLAVDGLMRRINDVASFSRVTETFPSRGPGPLPSAPFEADGALVVGPARDITQVMVAVGLLFDLRGGYTTQIKALVPAGGDGLRPQSTAVLILSKRF